MKTLHIHKLSDSILYIRITLCDNNVETKTFSSLIFVVKLFMHSIICFVLNQFYTTLSHEYNKSQALSLNKYILIILARLFSTLLCNANKNEQTLSLTTIKHKQSENRQRVNNERNRIYQLFKLLTCLHVFYMAWKLW